MSNRHAIHRTGRDRAVSDLLSILHGDGTLNRSLYEQAARASGYSVRQLQRQVAKQDLKKPPATGDGQDGRFSVDEDVVEMVMRTCGNLTNAHRRLAESAALVPSLSTFRRKVIDAMGATQMAYAKDASTRARVSKVYLKRAPENRGYSYLLDHTELPIYVIPDGYSTATRPWMTAVMDAQSRYVLSWVVTFGTPTAEEIRAALILAFILRLASDGTTIVGGLPERAVWDRGLDFLADLITQSCLRLQVTPVALPAYSPHLKGSLERFWRFVKENALATMPGYIDAGRDLRGNALFAGKALSQAAFMTELAEWMDFYNTRHRNRAIEGTALEAWQRDDTPLREVPTDQLWVDFLIAKNHVKVGKAGIRFAKIDYVALDGELDKVFGQHVEVRYLPHDHAFIEVFHDGQHLATCYPADGLRPDDEQAFIKARKKTDAAARKAFSSANRMRGQQREAQSIEKVTGKGKTHYQLTPAPELDLFDGGDEALKLFQDLPEDNGQGRLL
jgi:putative transposase